MKVRRSEDHGVGHERRFPPCTGEVHGTQFDALGPHQDLGQASARRGRGRGVVRPRETFPTHQIEGNELQRGGPRGRCTRLMWRERIGGSVPCSGHGNVSEVKALYLESTFRPTSLTNSKGVCPSRHAVLLSAVAGVPCQPHHRQIAPHQGHVERFEAHGHVQGSKGALDAPRRQAVLPDSHHRTSDKHQDRPSPTSTGMRRRRDGRGSRVGSHDFQRSSKIGLAKVAP